MRIGLDVNKLTSSCHFYSRSQNLLAKLTFTKCLPFLFLLGTLITLATIYQRLLRHSCLPPMFMYVCSYLPISALRLPVLPFSITSMHSAVQVPWSLFYTLWSLHSQIHPQVLGVLQGSVEGTQFSLR